MLAAADLQFSSLRSRVLFVLPGWGRRVIDTSSKCILFHLQTCYARDRRSSWKRCSWADASTTPRTHTDHDSSDPIKMLSKEKSGARNNASAIPPMEDLPRHLLACCVNLALFTRIAWPLSSSPCQLEGDARDTIRHSCLIACPHRNKHFDFALHAESDLENSEPAFSPCFIVAP